MKKEETQESERHITAKPDKWVVLKISGYFYKVFATWGGGYLAGDSWKANSGISRVEQDDDWYYFYGFSGSCYKCSKKGYGVASSYGLSVLNTMLENSGGQVELMENTDDWESIIHLSNTQ